MSELANYVQWPPYHHQHKPGHFQQCGQGTLCYIMQTCISFASHTACAGAVVQRPHKSAQHAHRVLTVHQNIIQVHSDVLI